MPGILSRYQKKKLIQALKPIICSQRKRQGLGAVARRQNAFLACMEERQRRGKRNRKRGMEKKTKNGEEKEEKQGRRRGAEERHGRRK